MRNFLIGKKEVKKKKIEAAFSAEHHSITMESQPGTPKVKRKWSFRKLSGKETSHKLTKSFDSIDTSKLQVQVPTESVARQNHVKALVVFRGHVKNAAATKIQAAFRTYLVQTTNPFSRTFTSLRSKVPFFVFLWIMVVSGEESIACIKGTSEVTSTCKGSHSQETDGIYFEAHARFDVDPSQSSLSENSDGRGSTARC